MGIVSYAQNFEDVMLWRALGHIERGFYIDVGAQDPTVDSVSKAFYEHGWRGIHVEPAVFYADLMRKDRPDELVIQAAIAQRRGLLRFFEIPDTGMSTASPEIAEHHRKQGHIVRETTVTALTLDDVFARAESGDIHWLKIDVEGLEKEVLSGWRKPAHRPWIIVIESTYPNSQQETHQAWESRVLAKGYTLAHVDGLNRYYLADAHEELKEAFRFGPNFFDGFQLADSSWSVGLIKQRYEEKLAGIDRQRAEIESQLATLRETLAHTEAGAAEREGRLREETELRLEAVRAEARAHLQQLGERERAFGDQLSQIQREAAERQSELNVALLTQNEARLALQLQLAELNGQIEAARNLEAVLRADLSRQAGQTATIAAAIAQMRRTLSWRLTAPLRKLEAIFGQQANDSVSGQPTGIPISIPDPESLTPPLDSASPAESIPVQPNIVSPAMLPATHIDEIPAATTLDELLSLYDAAFVHCAYRTLLGREPDPVGLGYYLARVRSGVSRRQILAQLRLSAEGRARGTRLAGLDKAIRRYKWLNRPVIGTLLRGAGVKEHPVSISRKLRTVENQLYRSAAITDRRFSDIGTSLREIHRKLADNKVLPAPALTITGSLAAPLSAGRQTNNLQPGKLIYYFVDHTIACPVNTGMQRLARRLGRALVERGDAVRFVKWKAEGKKFALINRDELAHLSRWNGPSLKPSELRLYPSQTEDAPALDIDDIGQDGWLLVPEVTHITYQEHPVTLDVVMEARRLGARVAFIYYDAIPLRLHEYKEAAAQHEEYMQALLLADAIFPISNRSAEELKAFFVHHQKATSIPRVQALHLSGESGLSPRVAQPRDNLHNSRIILSVGSIEPRKNQLKLIEAFERFSALPQGKGWRLVLAGHLRADAAPAVRAALRRNPNIRYEQHPSDEQLDSLYRSAAFTVFPSVEEGFGLPILESLWCAIPCICAKFGAMGEIAEGGGCLAIDTTKVEEIFGAIVRLSGDSRLLAELSRQATTRAIPGWSEYAQEISSLLTRSNDCTASFRGIYYWVDDTASNAHNSGIQRVVRQLARALIASGINLIPVRWDSANKRMRHAVDSDLMHLAKWNGPNPGDWAKWVEPSAIGAPGWLLIPELVHGVLGDVKRFVESANMRCAAIFYDAIPYKLNAMFPAAFAEAHARYMQDLASFDRVFAISRFSFDDLRQFLLSSRIRCHSFDHRFKPVPLPTQFVEYGRCVIAKKSDNEIIRMLAVISAEPRKNPLALLDAFSKAAKASSRRLVLTLVGRRIEYFSRLAEEVAARLRNIPGATWEQDVDDVRLRELYEQADFTVFPSLEEGFGLPIVESIWNARPCIVHNSGSMAEIAADGGCVQVDMRDAAALADAILALAEGDELRDRVAAAAIAHPVRTWGDYAKEIVAWLATDRKSDCVERIAAMGNVDIYKELPNLKPRPALSVCISTYNRGPWLRLNLQNLFAQIPDPVDGVEVLVVDNASTDNTAEVIATYAGRKDFRYVRNRKNVGMLGNLTVTAHQARGDYIWILGDDDLLKPNAIRRVMKAIKDHPDVALVYLNYAYTYEKDPSNIGNVAEFLDKCPAIVASGGDQYSPIRQIVTKNENLFTAIYCLVLRRDHAIRAYSQNTGGRPFATMRTSVPTTYYVLNYMMDEPAYWIGDPALVVNFNVSWNQYASLQILERVPEALDLAERLGADSPGTDRWRENIVPGFAHYWREMYESDTMGNSAFFAPERLVMRMKHLDAFASIVPPLAEIYERAHRTGHPAAQAPASNLFCAFNVEGAA